MKIDKIRSRFNITGASLDVKSKKEWPVFETYADMMAAGWIRVFGTYTICHHRCCSIRVSDATRGHRRGDNYVVRVSSTREEIFEAEGYFSQNWGRISEVEVTGEKNRMGRLGVFTHAFPPGELEAAVEKAKAWIDSKLDMRGVVGYGD